MIYPLLATLIISLLSLIGMVTLSLSNKILGKIVILLLSLSAGTLLGGAFFHLLPEAIHELGADLALQVSLGSFLLFFLVEKILHWRHCHKPGCKIHSFGFMNLIGDAIHNFIDGLVIAGAFAIDLRLGLITTLSIGLHELPQEIGDFGVLIHAGFSKARALFFNFMSASTVILGAVVGYYLSHAVAPVSALLLALAAGGFLYIAASDLLPELRQEKSLRKVMASFFVLLVGISLMYSVTLIFPEHDHGIEAHQGEIDDCQSGDCS